MEVWGGNRATDSSLEMPGLKVRVFSQPYEGSETGGDVYYISSCASGRLTRMLLADVCGHGAEVAQTADMLRQTMRQNVNYINQGRVVSRVNEQFSNIPETSRFATALVASYFAPARSLNISNAGHPQPFVYRTRTGQWSVLEPRGPEAQVRNLPLGIDDRAQFRDYRTRLEESDVVFFYTDALTDVVVRSERLGVSGLLRVLSELRFNDPAEIIDSLLPALAAVSTEEIQQDDLTALVIECTTSKATLRDNLLAPFRLIRGLFHG